jgi:antitoxin ParD1/3/4
LSARNVSLTDHLDAFVDEQIRNGRHLDASDVVREALRRYEDAIIAERERAEAIRSIIREGREDIASGRFTTIACEADVDALRARMTRRPSPASAS